MRTFVAIAMPEPVQAALERVQDALPVGRMVDIESLHLTLAFLGEQPRPMIETVHEALERVTVTPFTLTLTGLGTFEGREGGSLWAGVADPAPLDTLQARIRAALHGAGLMLDRRRFRPHVTLARLGRMTPDETTRLAAALGRWQRFDCPPVPVTGFTLWESLPARYGKRYQPLADYPDPGWDAEMRSY